MRYQEDKINALLDAREKIYEAVDLIKFAVQGTGLESRTNAYCISSLEKIASEDSQWLGKTQVNIDELIEAVKNPEDY